MPSLRTHAISPRRSTPACQFILQILGLASPHNHVSQLLINKLRSICISIHILLLLRTLTNAGRSIKVLSVIILQWEEYCPSGKLSKLETEQAES